MLKKLREVVTDPEMWPHLLCWPVILWMIIPGPAGDMFGALSIYLVFVFIACCVGLTLFGRAGGLLAFWGGVFLFVGAVVFRIVKVLTGWTP